MSSRKSQLSVIPLYRASKAEAEYVVSGYEMERCEKIQIAGLTLRFPLKKFMRLLDGGLKRQLPSAVYGMYVNTS